jgi:hypothetical protein
LVKPYTDDRTEEGFVIRSFDSSVDEKELVWHRDIDSRSIKILETGDGWYFQEDNKNPVLLKKGDVFNINSMTYHRIKKGENNLIILIKTL